MQIVPERTLHQQERQQGVVLVEVRGWHRVVRERVRGTGWTTMSAGSSSNDHCYVPCPIGRYSSGFGCEPCNSGTYSDRIGQSSCNECPKGTYTSSGDSDARRVHVCYLLLWKRFAIHENHERIELRGLRRWESETGNKVGRRRRPQQVLVPGRAGGSLPR